ncbi:MAG: matrixin family metalloprotease [Lactobacillaceae bacterium]|nr:matrixin family metalloprotease [Lactobacillaceae bacterium]
MRRFLLLLSILITLLGVGTPVDAAPISSINQSSIFSESDEQTTGNNSTQAVRAGARKLSIPTSTPVPIEGYRWPTRRLKIYMETQDKPLQAAFRGAVKAWNKTGAVHISWCRDKGRADIITQDSSLSSTAPSTNVGYVSSQLGSTSTEYNPDTHALIRARSTLDAGSLDYASLNFRTEVAEHELGHALGLAHAPEYMHSVMIPRNVKTGITKEDRATVRLLYGAH